MFATPTLRSLTLLSALVMAGCASDYRLVRTGEIKRAHQCTVASERNRQVLTEQHTELARTLAQLNEALTENRKAVSNLTSPENNCLSLESNGSPAASDSSPSEPSRIDKQVVGVTEPVRFEDLRLTLPALVNTAVDAALLDARAIQPFERNGEDWVRFDLPVGTGGEPERVERRLQKRQSLPGAPDRPVVQLRFKVGELSQSSDFILVDRTGQDYPVVLGRLAIRDLMIVDVSQRNAPPRQPADQAANPDGDT